jgi:hypothetical protein
MSLALKIGFFKPFALSLSKGDGHGPFMVRQAHHERENLLSIGDTVFILRGPSGEG